MPIHKRELLWRSALALLILCLLLSNATLQAASATWNLNPANGDWNSSLNWSPATVPNGSTDVATFGLSNVSNVFLSANTEVNGAVFNANASAYSITVSPARTLTFSGAGLTNNSNFTQRFIADVNGSVLASIEFRGSANAGSSTEFTNKGGAQAAIDGAATEFFDNSNAGNATFNNDGGTVTGAGDGRTSFFDDSTAANATFINKSATVRGASGGATGFNDNSTAANATFINYGSALGGPNGSADGGQIFFGDKSTAANATITNHGGEVDGALSSTTKFEGQATAAQANITNDAGAASGAYGALSLFLGSSSAGSSSIINNAASVAGAGGGQTYFFDNSTAENSTITSKGSSGSGTSAGATEFLRTSTAGNATLVAEAGQAGGEGGGIYFFQDSTGGTARIQVFGNGFVDISSHEGSTVTIGSLEGTGQAFLGANNLTVGSNNLSTEFSGAVHDGGPFDGEDVGGSFIKTGTGTLTLSGTNTYTGSTVVMAGALIINGSVTSPVNVNGGRLGGSGSTLGVTVNSTGTLAPGSSAGILHVSGNLTFIMGATYLVDLNGNAVGTQYDQTDVLGLVSLHNATLSVDVGFSIALGDQFTIISNDGADSVTGIFAGLNEGSTFVSGNEAFQISYHGGDGNDVILTAVVPEPAAWLLFSSGAALLCGILSRRPSDTVAAVSDRRS